MDSNENIIRIGIFKRPEALTVARFRDYWHYHHAAIASNMTGMQHYDQNHIIRPADLGIAPVNPRECAGMSKIWFGSMENNDNNDPETMGRLAIDEKYLFEAMDLVVCRETVHMRRESGKPFVKYICLLRRNSAISEDDFRARLAATASKMLAVPGLTGYVENVVLSRTYNDIQGEKRYFDVPYEQVPIDAVIELSFKFEEKYILGDVFDSKEGHAVQEDTRGYLSDAACYLTNVYHIV